MKEQNEAKENLYDHNSFLYYHIVKDKRVVLEYKLQGQFSSLVNEFSEIRSTRHTIVKQ